MTYDIHSPTAQLILVSWHWHHNSDLQNCEHQYTGQSATTVASGHGILRHVKGSCHVITLTATAKV